MIVNRTRIYENRIQIGCDIKVTTSHVVVRNSRRSARHAFYPLGSKYFGVILLTVRLNVISITTRLMSSGAGFTVTGNRKTLTAVKSKRQ